MYLGSIYAAKKNTADAITIYEKIIAYDDDNIIALYYLDGLNAELKDGEKAKRYFAKVLELKPNFWSLHSWIWAPSLRSTVVLTKHSSTIRH